MENEKIKTLESFLSAGRKCYGDRFPHCVLSCVITAHQKGAKEFIAAIDIAFDLVSRRQEIFVGDITYREFFELLKGRLKQ
jgi:hypothetical protein